MRTIYGKYSLGNKKASERNFSLLIKNKEIIGVVAHVFF